MTRFAGTCKLVSHGTVVCEDGSAHESPTERPVFCNVMNIGARTWAAARGAGLHADAQVQVRACDYHGEDSLVMGGEEYNVERAQATGEFVSLTLKRRLRNG